MKSQNSSWNEFKNVAANEYKYILKDAGVILIFAAVLIYSLLYSLAYKNEVLRDIPIAVVDYSHTPSSRQMAQRLEATPNLNVTQKPQSLQEAKTLFLNRDVYGIVVIPADYEQKILSNRKTFLSIYTDASYFLMYKQVFSAVVAALGDVNAQIKSERYLNSGASSQQAQALAEPVVAVTQTLFNPYSGYGSFVMPAILILIIQQTLLIGIGMIGGSWRERNLYRKLIPHGSKHLSALPIVLGKTCVYLSIYSVSLFLVFGGLYKIFGFPMNCDVLSLIAFLIPYLLASIFLGLALSSVFQHRENSILILLFTSIPLLMISGVSVPIEALPDWLVTTGKIVPSSSAIPGFISLQTMGASLTDVISQQITLWSLTGVYFILACLGMRRVARKAQ